MGNCFYLVNNLLYLSISSMQVTYSKALYNRMKKDNYLCDTSHIAAMSVV